MRKKRDDLVEVVTQGEQGRDVPSVTVTVSLYNYRDYIIECLESVKAQTTDRLDLIVVDDCSTDGSLEVARDWLTENGARFAKYQLIRHRMNGGLADARNTAFDNARTEYVFILDADNTIYPQCLQRLADALKGCSASFAYSYLERFGDATGLQNTVIWDPTLLHKSNPTDAMVLLRRSVWRDVGGYSTTMPVMGNEDFDMWFRIARRKGWGVRVPEVLARYRVHGRSMLNTITSRKEEEIWDYLRSKYCEFFPGTISVVIPVKNAGDKFEHLLAMLRSQRDVEGVEIVVVDSGSTDGTLEIARAFGATIVQIPPEEFSHSRARNVGADHATGSYIVFTVQDALPPSEVWLRELLDALKRSDVAAVSCTEFPREDADLFYRVNLWAHYRGRGLDEDDRVMELPATEDPVAVRIHAQLYSIACLMPRELFMRYRYRGDYAEDLDLGLRLLRDGHRIGAVRSVGIIHSHNRPAYYYLKRAYVEMVTVCQLLNDHQTEIPAERLLRDVVDTYNMLGDLVEGELGQVRVPCRVEDLSRVVTQRVLTARAGGHRVDGEIVHSPYVDWEFLDFLHNIHWQRDAGPNETSGSDGVLLDAVAMWLRITFEYMAKTYEVIDDGVLEELKAHLYKAYAFECGRHLAYCYLQRREDERERLEAIHRELSRGV